MENSVNETERVLTSRLVDWSGCLEGRARDRRAKVAKRDKDRKMHTTVHVCSE